MSAGLGGDLEQAASRLCEVAAERYPVARALVEANPDRFDARAGAALAKLAGAVDAAVKELLRAAADPHTSVIGAPIHIADLQRRYVVLARRAVGAKLAALDGTPLQGREWLDYRLSLDAALR